MTARLAVLGNPIGHSRSPDIHRWFGEAAGVDLTYERILVPDGEFSEVVTEFFADPEAIGANVTVPCKSEAWQFVDKTSQHANRAQAVNTLHRQGDGSILGDNTDGEGLVADLTSNLGWQLADKRILVLGAGGAVRGVLGNLIARNPAHLHLFNRTRAKAEALVSIFGEPLEVTDFTEPPVPYDVIINGTSASLAGQEISLPREILSESTCCYDMVYGNEVTAFNAWCLSQVNCTVADGLGMLVEQAASAFEIWFGVRPPTASVLENLRTTL